MHSVIVLDKAQLELRQRIRDLTEQYVAPRAAEIDQQAAYPDDIRAMFQRDSLFGLVVPSQYGGMRESTLDLCIAIEELARHCATSSLILAVHELGTLPLMLAGTEEQKQRYLQGIARGDTLVAFGLTEPEAGSDAGATKTRALRDGDSYVLSGKKHYITNAGKADLVTIFAMTDPERGTRGITAFLVERDTPGFSYGKHDDKMGIRGMPTGEIFLDGVHVPANRRLGEEGQGFKIAMMTLDHSRPGIAAQALGIAQGALDAATAFAKQRHQFGKPIADLQAIQFMLADMAAQIEAARALVYNAAKVCDIHDRAITAASAMAKLVASDTAMRVTTDAVQIFGGAGYMRGCPVERMMRDAKITQIYEGTNQIQRLVIARQLLN